MSTLYVMCGLSRAGKTTKAKALEAETGAFRISIDDWRFALRHVCWGREADEIALEYAGELLRHGFDVIYDEMNLSSDERRRILRGCGAAKKICIFMDTPVEVIRQRGGGHGIGHFREPVENEGFDEIRRITWTKP